MFPRSREFLTCSLFPWAHYVSPFALLLPPANRLSLLAGDLTNLKQASGQSVDESSLATTKAFNCRSIEAAPSDLPSMTPKDYA